MNFFKRPLGKSEPLLPMPKGAEVYYSTQQILIAARLHDIRGFHGGGQPRVLLPLDTPAVTLGEHVLQAIDASQNGLSEEDLKAVNVEMFELASVPGWDEMEKQWENINVGVELETNMILLQPMHRYERGGYGGLDDDPIYRCRFDADEVGQVVRKIIDGPPPEVLTEEPGHT